MAEGARLESVYTGNRIVGSNPTPSATPKREEHPTFSEWMHDRQLLLHNCLEEVDGWDGRACPRHGAIPKRSVRNSRKALTRGVR